jgi:3-hydroxyisobutyrate dehydrogenase-like beta-hydroxyacid dehydrogenase
MTKTIAIISPGNMGSSIARFLIQGGFRVIAPLEGRSDFTKRRSLEIGIEDSVSIKQAVEEADIVLSILDPGKAMETAQIVGATIKQLGCAKVFADCNATSPDTAAQMNEIIVGAGGSFIDVGIIGGTPTRKENFPTFFASGPEAKALEIIDGHGVQFVDLGPQIGRGSAIKICNGAWNKGAFALYTAVMLAAEHYGFTAILRDRLPSAQAGTVEKIDEALNRLPSLAGRYVGEMEEVAETYQGIGLPNGFHEAAAEIFKTLDGTSLGSERRETIDPDRSSLEVLKRLAAELRLGEAN